MSNDPSNRSPFDRPASADGSDAPGQRVPERSYDWYSAVSHFRRAWRELPRSGQESLRRIVEAAPTAAVRDLQLAASIIEKADAAR